jgi:hypothetical protein
MADDDSDVSQAPAYSYFREKKHNTAAPAKNAIQKIRTNRSARGKPFGHIQMHRAISAQLWVRGRFVSRVSFGM